MQRNQFFTDVYDVSDPVAPVLLGQKEHDLEDSAHACGLDAVVGERVAGKLVWRPKISFGSYNGGWFIDDIAFDGVAADIVFPGRGGYYWGSF